MVQKVIEYARVNHKESKWTQRLIETQAMGHPAKGGLITTLVISSQLRVAALCS